MYIIKNFSNIKLREILFSKSLSEVRKTFGSYESSIAAHVLMFIKSDEVSEYWIHEISRFVTDKIQDLDRKQYKNMSYKNLFPYYLMGESSRKNQVINKAKKKIVDEDDPNFSNLPRYLDSDLIVNILDEFSTGLDYLKDKYKRTLALSTDEDEIGEVLIRIRDKYKSKLV